MNFLVGAIFVFTVFVAIFNYEMLDKYDEKRGGK